MTDELSLYRQSDLERWRDDLIQYLDELGGKASLAELYEHIEAHPKRELRDGWQKRVRFTIYESSSDSEIWDGVRDLFQHIGDRRSGVWALRVQRERIIATDTDGFNEDVGSTLPPARRTYVRSVVIRNRKLATKLKKRCDYICERCGSAPAWRTAKGLPYVEAHHLIPLGENGFDDVRNLMIVCPGCHRFLHYAIDRETEIARLLKLRGLDSASAEKSSH